MPKTGSSKQIMIPLTGFQGWPKGQLAEQIQHAIPAIISAQSIEKK
jgi:hypothetical protein